MTSAVPRPALGKPSGSRLPVIREGWGGVGDLCFLFLVYFMSAVAYLPQLGFYSDDWSIIATFEFNPVFSAIDSMLKSGTSPRPVQFLWLAGLYEIFGQAPLGYHLVKSGILLANALLFYLCLRELRQPHLVTIAVPAVFITLPNYSTIHVWISGSTVSISMALYFVSLYCDLRAIRATWVRARLLKLSSMGALVGSALAYECAIPLFLLNPLLVWYASNGDSPQPSNANRNRYACWSLLGRNLALILSIFLYKQLTKPDLLSSVAIAEGPSYVIRRLLHTLLGRTRNEGDFGFNLWQFIDVDVFERGLKLPLLALRACKYLHWPEFAATAALGVIGFAYLSIPAIPDARPYGIRPMRPRGWLALSAAGLGAALCGYAVFLVLPNISFTIAGLINRVSMAAAAGMAVFLVGLTGYLTCDLPTERVRRTGFALLATIFIGSGCLVNYAIASHWTAAYNRQIEILNTIRSHFPTLPKGSALILDGTCPFIGPGIVFATTWDLAGALQLLYRDPDLRAEIVTPLLEVVETGLKTTEYGRPIYYPYGPDLIIYDFRHNVDRHLLNRQAAESYFTEVSGDRASRCVWGHTSLGVPIFSSRLEVRTSPVAKTRSLDSRHPQAEAR
jgi:hypothetical protein